MARPASRLAGHTNATSGDLHHLAATSRMPLTNEGPVVRTHLRPPGQRSPSESCPSHEEGEPKVTLGCFRPDRSPLL